jgi:hypothetical protein
VHPTFARKRDPESSKISNTSGFPFPAGMTAERLVKFSTNFRSRTLGAVHLLESLGFAHTTSIKPLLKRRYGRRANELERRNDWNFGTA